VFSHTHVGTNDFPRSFAFYSALMNALGCPLKFSEPERPWAGWKPQSGDRPLFLLGTPYDGQNASPGNGQMIAFMASSRGTVIKCHKAAIENGGRCEGPPGIRSEYHPNYFGAYFRDPDGNKLCVCCHDPEYE
jgi:catechol 2,3-dioxygenase-like lactoylglutathione lyase family enzyme